MKTNIFATAVTTTVLAVGTGCMEPLPIPLAVTITNLQGSIGLTLMQGDIHGIPNEEDELVVSSPYFIFPTWIPYQGSYLISITSQPDGYICAILDNSMGWHNGGVEHSTVSGVADATINCTEIALTVTKVLDNSDTYHSFIYTYDTTGRVLSEAYPQGSYNLPFTHSYTYDANGNTLIHAINYTPLWAGYNRSFNYTYDANNSLLSETVHLGNLGYTQSSSTYSYTYDSNNNPLSKTVDPGLANSYTHTYTYDANNNLLSETVDSALFYTYTYDTNNNLLSVTRNSTLIRTYDANNNLLSDASGSPHFTYTYDANNNRLSETKYYVPDDGIPDSIITYTYDTNNNLLSESVDSQADGTPNYIYTYTYEGDTSIQIQPYTPSYLR